MGGLAGEHQQVQELLQHTADNITNPVATGLGGTAGILTIIYNSIPTAITLLTIFIRLCQAVAWGYKIYKWGTKTQLYKRLTGK